MKKLILSLTAVICTLIMGLTLAACSSGVAGNSYVFSDYTITFASDYEDEKPTDEELSEMIAEAKEHMEGMTYSFDNEGKVTATQGEEDEGEVAYYKQVDNKVFVGWETKEEMEAATEDDLKEMEEDGEYLEVSGNKVLMSYSYGGVTYTYTYTKK